MRVCCARRPFFVAEVGLPGDDFVLKGVSRDASGFSNGLRLTSDALVGVCWQMKKKRVQTPWAALRFGFSGRDWAAESVDVLAEAGLPGEDFVLNRAVSQTGLLNISKFHFLLRPLRNPPLAASRSQRHAVLLLMNRLKSC